VRWTRPQRSRFGRHANRDLSREQSDRDRIRLRFFDESLPSRLVETRLPAMGTMAESRNWHWIYQRPRELSWRHLLGSLPSVLHDEDEGIAEALRCDAEFESVTLHVVRGTRPTDRKPSKLMRLVLHPKVYSDIQDCGLLRAGCDFRGLGEEFYTELRYFVIREQPQIRSPDITLPLSVPRRLATKSECSSSAITVDIHLLESRRR
jgi:hypothetical protein